MTTAHTPGPWFQSDEDNQIRANTEDGHTTICEMWSTDSDARLIAAAPDLLTAAELVIERWARGDLAGAVRMLDAAVSAAKGGSL